MRAPVFDDLLDEHLAVAPSQLSPAGGLGPAGTAAAYGFFFTPSDASRTSGSLPVPPPASVFTVSGAIDRRSDVNGGAVGGSTKVHTTGHARRTWSERARACAMPARRVLSAREQEAVAEMETLGARLPVDFTFDELRRAFRTLALEYHPDRHAQSTTRDKAQLGQLFTRAREAYRVLAGLFTRVH